MVEAGLINLALSPFSTRNLMEEDGSMRQVRKVQTSQVQLSALNSHLYEFLDYFKVSRLVDLIFSSVRHSFPSMIISVLYLYKKNV